MGCVSADGEEINRNRLVALASVIALDGNSGATVVTDSLTSDGLREFIEKDLGGKQLRFILGNRGIGLDKPRCHFLNPAHEVGGAVAALCNPGKARFPFCRKLRGRKAVGQNSDKVIPVLCGD